MDFSEAANAHRDWKIRLRTYVNGGGEPLDELEVRRDDACDLGRWLHARPAEERGAVHLELMAVHARFHQCAGDVVATVQRGQREQAVRMMDAGTAFADASFRVVGLIARLTGSGPRKTGEDSPEIP